MVLQTFPHERDLLGCCWTTFLDHLDWFEMEEREIVNELSEER